MHGKEKVVDSKNYPKILSCSLNCCNLCEQRSKNNSSPSYVLKVQRERDCNFEKPCSRANGRKSYFFSSPELGPMVVTNKTAVGFTFKTTSLFEKLYTHMFSFLNNSAIVWQYGVSEIAVSFSPPPPPAPSTFFFFFTLQEKFSIS